MKTLTAKQMQILDRWAIEKLGIPQIALMENAGRAVAEEIIKFTKKHRICIVAYKGNNGGDGLVAARHLRNLGCDVSVFLLCDEIDLSGAAKSNLDIIRKLNIPIYNQKSVLLNKLLRSSDIVVDAIFGIGFSGKISDEIAKAIDLINDYRKKHFYTVVAVDVPSGVNATSGKIDQHTIAADLTVTFAYPKTGLLKYPAIKKIGRLVVTDIGIPYKEIPVKQLNKFQLNRGVHNEEFLLSPRLVWTNKGDYGRVLIIAGSRNMSGAAYLTAQAALRSGAGLVYLAVPQSIQKIVATKSREVITIGLPETEEGTISLEASDQLNKIKASVVAIGPGITTQPETVKLVKKLITYLKVVNLVLDADGLNCIADDPTILKKAKSKITITPHPGEMGRLLGKKVVVIQKNRSKIAQAAARKWGVEVVLKGAYTIVTGGEKSYINSTGNPGMASAGAGDVLAGLVAGFLAQGLTTKAAVYVHGLAGNLAAKEKGERGLIASDIIEKIPYAIQKIT